MTDFLQQDEPGDHFFDGGARRQQAVVGEDQGLFATKALGDAAAFFSVEDHASECAGGVSIEGGAELQWNGSSVTDTPRGLCKRRRRLERAFEARDLGGWNR